MIKHFLKIFFSSLVLITVILSVTGLGYIIFDKDITVGTFIKEQTSDIETEKEISATFDYDTTFGEKISKSNVINVLVVGLEHSRTDTILVASYDSDTKVANIISLPRDTYYPRDVNDRADAKKINAVYGSEGIEGLIDAAQDIMGVPIQKYVIFNYEGVVACVDLLGGVDVDVPFHMEYSDPYDDPPLIIDIPEGLQTLNGENSLKFLRFRHGYANQDLGRIEAQQQFIKSAVKKAIGLQLPALIKKAYSYIETNFTVNDLVKLSGDAIGFSTDNINVYTLPGTETPLEGLSFFIRDDNEIEKLTHTIYGIPFEEDN